MLYPIHYFLLWLYLRKVERKYSIFNVEFGCDMFLGFLALLKSTLVYNRIIIMDLDEIQGYEKAQMIWDRVDEIKLQYYYGIMVAAAWFRILLLFKMNALLGPFIQVIHYCIHNLVIFLVMYAFNLVAFAVIGTIVIINNPRF